MGSPGIFDCRVAKAMRSVSSKKQTPCIAVHAEVDFLDGSELVWGNIYLTEATIGTPERPGMAVQQLRDLGWTGPLGEAYRNPAALVGGGGKCVVEETQGGLRIARFGVPREVEVAAFELARLEAIDARGKAPATAPDKDKPPAGFFGEDDAKEPSVSGFDRQLAEDRAASEGLNAHPEPGENFGKEASDSEIPF